MRTPGRAQPRDAPPPRCRPSTLARGDAPHCGPMPGACRRSATGAQWTPSRLACLHTHTLRACALARERRARPITARSGLPAAAPPVAATRHAAAGMRSRSAGVITKSAVSWADLARLMVWYTSAAKATCCHCGGTPSYTSPNSGPQGRETVQAQWTAPGTTCSAGGNGAPSTRKHTLPMRRHVV